MNGYRLPEQDLRAIGKNDFATGICFGLNRQLNKGTVTACLRMFLPIYSVPIMKNMISDIFLPAPLLLRKITPLPGGYACKHLLPDRFLFCHGCFLAKLFCRLIPDKRQVTGGLPLRSQCHTAKGNRVIDVNHNWNRLKQRADKRLKTRKGVQKRKQRCFDTEPVFEVYQFCRTVDLHS
jgi:hypothetical protein